MSPKGNLYDILGVKRYASIDEVRSTFKQLALKYHPDRNPNNPKVEEMFKRMVAAYNVLSDEEKKRNYDLRLSGFYTFKKKEETEEEKKAKRREQVRKMRQKLKEKEEREILETYEKAKQILPYKWRYSVVVFTFCLTLFIILSNWYRYDTVALRETAFFKMFAAYCLSMFMLVFFLSSLFKKWNAESLKKKFSFNIRNRISTFFMMYIFLMISFSLNVPKYYKRFHLNSFGQTTTGKLYYDVEVSSAVVEYTVGDETIVKNLGTGGYYSFALNGGYKVKLQYSSLSPHIVEIKGLLVDDFYEL
jgi:curved DNA-binding protein CbpA